MLRVPLSRTVSQNLRASAGLPEPHKAINDLKQSETEARSLLHYCHLVHDCDFEYDHGDGDDDDDDDDDDGDVDVVDDDDDDPSAHVCADSRDWRFRAGHDTQSMAITFASTRLERNARVVAYPRDLVGSFYCNAFWFYDKGHEECCMVLVAFCKGFLRCFCMCVSMFFAKISGC